MCWYWHPPHFWKSWHSGVTRCSDGSMTWVSSASEQFFLLLMMRALMVSPGMVKGTKITQSVSPWKGTSIRATPSPWLESESIFSSSSWCFGNGLDLNCLAGRMV